MIAYEVLHSPEGIEDLKINVAHTIRERLNDRSFMFINTNTVAEIDSMSTIGYASIGLPDIVFGLNLGEDNIYFWEGAVEKLQRYMIIYGFPEPDQPIDPIQFANFGLGEEDPPITSLDELPAGSRRYRLLRLDAERWFSGDGWQHAVHYTEKERSGAVVFQWVLPDAEDRYPGDEGYVGPYQHIYETEPFGSGVKVELSPERIARNRFMH